MNNLNFDYQGAKQAGYNDEEITQYLSQAHPNFDYQSALKSGYKPEEINEYLSNLQSQQPEQPQERSILEKAGRLGGQVALGAASMAALPYEIAVAPLGIPGGQEAMGDLFTNEILSDVYGPNEHMDAQNIRELREPIDLSIKGLAEKATGLDLKPEGVLEKAANWIGVIKDPKKIIQAGLNLKELVKAISPTGKELLRGASAGIALQAAEEGEYGPIGTMAALVLSDIAGGKVADIGKKGKELLNKPKETLANIAAKFTKADEKALQQELIKDFKDSGIQADLGTLTGSDLVKWTQTKLSQSGFTGKALNDLKAKTTQQIKEEYKSLANSLGEAKFTTQHEAGEAAKDTIKKVRDADLLEVRGFYRNAEEALTKTSYVNPSKLMNVVKDIEKNLGPGQLKSGEQKAVLDVLQHIKRDISDSTGATMMANVKDLINNKIALNDVINYEVQGGTKQLLKQVVGELDRAIISHAKDNPKFARNYVMANKRFSEHAKTFRSKNVNSIINAADPALVMTKMNTVQGIKDLEKSLKGEEGKKLFNELKRKKLDDVIESNFIDSTTQQVKLGTFSKLLEKGKNREIIKEILDPKAFVRLERLQKNAGRLAEANAKFYNASQSGATAIDAAVIMKGMNDFVNLFAGNPWPLVKTGGIVVGAKKLSKLMGDTEFLKLVEEAMLASEKNNPKQLINAYEKLTPYFQKATENN